MATKEEGANAVENLKSTITNTTTLDGDARKKIIEEIDKNKTLQIAVSGKTGSGKSCLLNMFVGKKVFEEAEDEDIDPHTKIVDEHRFTKEGVAVTVWDCPGLQDGTTNEDAYLQDLVAKTSDGIDLLLYCISMNETKFTRNGPNEQAIIKLTTSLGPNIWKNTLVVLTFANSFAATLKDKRPDISKEDLLQKFNKRIDSMKERFKEILHALKVEKGIIEALPFQAAGYATTPHLLGIQYWCSAFWMKAVSVISESKRYLPILLNHDRIKDTADAKDSDFQKPIEKQPILMAGLGAAVSGLASGAATVAAGSAMVGSAATAGTLTTAVGGLTALGTTQTSIATVWATVANLELAGLPFVSSVEILGMLGMPTAGLGSTAGAAAGGAAAIGAGPILVGAGVAIAAGYFLYRYFSKEENKTTAVTTETPI